MNLLAPQNFLFAGLLGVVLLMYVLRLKRKERVVSSTLLWQTALRDMQANAPWQKLRSSLLMWLQLLFLLLAVLALVRPAIKVLAGGGQTVAIVLDASASMGATDVGPSRFERARSEAGRLINGLGSGDGATVVAAGAQTKVLSPLTTDKNLLKRAVANARVQDTGGNLREAIVLASSLLRGKKNPQIYVVSDGAFAPLPDLNLGNTGLQFVKIGSRRDNIAITAMDVRRPYGRGGQPQIFVTLSNFSTQARVVNLELSHDGELAVVRPVNLPAANGDVPGQQSQVFSDVKWSSGLFGASFDEKDDLASDNAAYASLSPTRPLKVLLLSQGNLFLERALNLDPNVQLSRGASGESGSDKGFDVVVCDGIAPPKGSTANQLVFNVVGPDSPVVRKGVAPNPGIVDWDKRHPVTQFAPWNDLRIAQSIAVETKAWARPIVEAERTALMVAGERKVNGQTQRVVWCGFDLRDSDLPLRVAFPIFITNALRWLSAPAGGEAISNEGVAPRAGQVVTLPAPDNATEISVKTPDGNTQQVSLQSRPITFAATDKTGIYTASSDKWTYPFGVSLLNKSESDTLPRNSIEIGGGKPVSGESSGRANRELWGFLALAALTLLGVEWWVFHRGV